jgi:2-phosphoglycolate phosphatase
MMVHGADIAAVFFDLDGTLVDSAPDMVVAMERLRAERGEPVADMAVIGAAVSKGGRAMIRRGFPHADETLVEMLLPRFLDLYAAEIAAHTRTFPGIDAMLDTLQARAIPWGVVTNKPGWLARALLAELTLDHRCSALVTGDCLAQKKPDPEPLLHACTLAQVEPARSVYIGDDARDIEAGRRAGMATVAAAWGYLDGEDPRDWQADRVVAQPSDLLAALGIE